MTVKENKYMGGTTHRLALLHAVGQLQIVNNGSVKISDVIDFMGVSKPTAIKHLKKLADNREIIMTKNENIGKLGQWKFCLHPDMQDEYNQGIYKPYFNSYCQRVLRVIVQ